MALTIRTTQEDEKLIEQAGSTFGISTGSKTLLFCVAASLKYHEKNARLSKELKELRNEIYSIKDAFRRKMMADSLLAKHLER